MPPFHVCFGTHAPVSNAVAELPILFNLSSLNILFPAEGKELNLQKWTVYLLSLYCWETCLPLSSLNYSCPELSVHSHQYVPQPAASTEQAL